MTSLAIEGAFLCRDMPRDLLLSSASVLEGQLMVFRLYHNEETFTSLSVEAIQKVLHKEVEASIVRSFGAMVSHGCSVAHRDDIRNTLAVLYIIRQELRRRREQKGEKGNVILPERY